VGLISERLSVSDSGFNRSFASALVLLLCNSDKDSTVLLMRHVNNEEGCLDPHVGVLRQGHGGSAHFGAVGPPWDCLRFQVHIVLGVPSLDELILAKHQVVLNRDHRAQLHSIRGVVAFPLLVALFTAVTELADTAVFTGKVSSTLASLGSAPSFSVTEGSLTLSVLNLFLVIFGAKRGVGDLDLSRALARLLQLQTGETSNRHSINLRESIGCWLHDDFDCLGLESHYLSCVVEIDCGGGLFKHRREDSGHGFGGESRGVDVGVVSPPVAPHLYERVAGVLIC